MINYHQAAKRHFADAELLMHNKRQANAGHLYGVSAECGIKSLLVAAGLPTTSTGDINSQQANGCRSHVNVLINVLETFLNGRAAASYLAMIPNRNQFSNWKVYHRYYIESALPQNVSDWRSATQEVMKMLDQATLDGVIT